MNFVFRFISKMVKGDIEKKKTVVHSFPLWTVVSLGNSNIRFCLPCEYFDHSNAVAG